ncbi:MAG: hypothetical protein SAJ12_22735, partial [Jaaginema sp. PMC 1079.18]|nr:hypothetical protein [Jaaginema sp. PMC 1079.18]
MAEEQQDQPQSLSKVEAIGRLRQTIQRLEAVVNQLDTESDSKLPSEATLDAIATNVENLAQTLETPTAIPVKPIPASEDKLSLIDRILPPFDWVQQTWDKAINQVRKVLPATLNQRLSDWAITGILATTIVAVLSTSVILTSLNDRPATSMPPEIADITPLTPTFEEELKPPLEPPSGRGEVPAEEGVIPRNPEITVVLEAPSLI